METPTHVEYASDLGLPPGYFPREIAYRGSVYTYSHSVYANGEDDAPTDIYYTNGAMILVILND
jgi:hypothetical protein